VKSDAGSPFRLAPAWSNAARTSSVTARFCVASAVLAVVDEAVPGAGVVLVDPAAGVSDGDGLEGEEQPASTTEPQRETATTSSFFGRIELLTCLLAES
jgi:hypothetical protein